MLGRYVGNAINDFISGNPLTTPIGTLIEEATEDFVGAELWQLFSEISNAINHSPNGPKDGTRALRRRFVTSVGVNETVSMHTLLLLEFCMANCGYRFHILVGTKAFLQDITQFVSSPTAGLSEQVLKKLLSLIQTWATQFATEVDLQEFVNIQKELKERKVNFVFDISTQPTIPSTTTRTSLPPASVSSPLKIPTRAGSPPKTTSVSTTAVEQHSSPKLSSDITQVRINVCTLSDLMSDAEATTAPEGIQLIRDVAASLQEMAQRLIHSISTWEAYRDSVPLCEVSDDILFELINVNDEVQTVLSRYSRLQSQLAVSVTTAAASTSSQPGGSKSSDNAHQPSEDANIASDYDSFVGAVSAHDQAGETRPQSSGAVADGDTVPLLVPEAAGPEGSAVLPSGSNSKPGVMDDVKLIDF